MYFLLALPFGTVAPNSVSKNCEKILFKELTVGNMIVDVGVVDVGV